MYLDVMNGSIACDNCFGNGETERTAEDISTARIILPLSPAVLGALRYVIGCPSKKIFSFVLPDEEKEDFCRVCEKYLVNQTERSLPTLEFYNRIKKL